MYIRSGIQTQPNNAPKLGFKGPAQLESLIRLAKNNPFRVGIFAERGHFNGLTNKELTQAKDTFEKIKQGDPDTEEALDYTFDYLAERCPKVVH